MFLPLRHFWFTNDIILKSTLSHKSGHRLWRKSRSIVLEVGSHIFKQSLMLARCFYFILTCPSPRNSFLPWKTCNSTETMEGIDGTSPAPLRVGTRTFVDTSLVFVRTFTWSLARSWVVRTLDLRGRDESHSESEKLHDRRTDENLWTIFFLL